MSLVRRGSVSGKPGHAALIGDRANPSLRWESAPSTRICPRSQADAPGSGACAERVAARADGRKVTKVMDSDRFLERKRRICAVVVGYCERNRQFSQQLTCKSAPTTAIAGPMSSTDFCQVCHRPFYAPSGANRTAKCPPCPVSPRALGWWRRTGVVREQAFLRRQSGCAA